jgi:hypothetical protein
MGGQPASGHSVPTTVVAPAQATWVDDIANALDSYFKAHYPTSDFTSALKKLTLVQDAEDRVDRRTVEVGVRTEITGGNNGAILRFYQL